jgi:hypothetical protein
MGMNRGISMSVVVATFIDTLDVGLYFLVANFTTHKSNST